MSTEPNTNQIQAVTWEVCAVCGYRASSEGPLETAFHTHSCMQELQAALKEAKYISQLNHEAAERCAGERDQWMKEAKELETEMDMLKFDMTTVRVQRDNATHFRKQLASELDDVKARLWATQECLEKWRHVVKFFRSVIKSGEGWTRKCEMELEDAIQSFFNIPEATGQKKQSEKTA